MADVKMSLSELDSMRDTIKNLKEGQESMATEKKKIENKLNDIIYELNTQIREKSPVIVKQKINNFSPIVFDDQKLRSTATDIIKFITECYRHNRTVSISVIQSYLHSYLKESSNINCCFYPKVLLSSEEIETVENFGAVESKVKEYFEKKYKSVYDEYIRIIANKNSIEENLHTAYNEHKLELETEYLKLKSDLLKEYEKLKEELTKPEVTNEQKLREVAHKLGYEVNATLFGKKLTLRKIKKMNEDNNIKL